MCVWLSNNFTTCNKFIKTYLTDCKLMNTNVYLGVAVEEVVLPRLKDLSRHSICKPHPEDSRTTLDQNLYPVYQADDQEAEEYCREHFDLK